MSLAPSIKERRPWIIMQESTCHWNALACVVDASGQIVREAEVASEPEVLIGWFGGLGLGLARVGLEAGTLSQWLYAAMKQAGLAVELLETRHVYRSRVCNVESTRVSNHRYTASTGIPCATVLTVSSVLSLATGLFCHHHRRDAKLHRQFDAASGRRDHTASPSASSAARLAPPKRPPHPAPNVRDDRETPLLVRRDSAGKCF